MQIPRRKPLTANVVMFSVGLKTYWEQFPGLLDVMKQKSDILAAKLAEHNVNVLDFGMIDNTPRSTSSSRSTASAAYFSIS